MNEHIPPSWNEIFSDERYSIPSVVQSGRSLYEQDYDRLIFSSAFRRLQDKTQVFPLPGHVFVHNRLTHSLEVASVGRSLGKLVGKRLSQLDVIKSQDEVYNFYVEDLKGVVSAACLAHDLGNPAFGHSGEAAIANYFEEHQDSTIEGQALRSYFEEAEWMDLLHFEGNANTIRLLTKRFNGRLNGGSFRLTYSTLAAIIKYPCESVAMDKKSGDIARKKYGFFQSEKDVFQRIAEHTGMRRSIDRPMMVYHRHPFVYLVEAADDICYNIIDLEDAHRLGILTHQYVRDLLCSMVCLNKEEDEKRFLSNVRALEQDPNEQVAYLRSKAINYLTHRCSDIFWTYRQDILAGQFNHDLIHKIPELQSLLQELKQISITEIYQHEHVVKVEIAGYKIISGLLEDLIPAALSSSPSPKQKNILKLMPYQYRFGAEATPYERCMAVLDYVSGMTDVYALELYRNLRGISLPQL